MLSELEKQFFNAHEALQAVVGVVPAYVPINLLFLSIVFLFCYLQNMFKL